MSSVLGRYGHTQQRVAHVQHNGIVPRTDELLVLDVSSSKLESVSRYPLTDSGGAAEIPRPLLVGTSTALTEHGQLVVIGGGATVGAFQRYYLPSTRLAGCFIPPLVNLYM